MTHVYVTWLIYMAPCLLLAVPFIYVLWLIYLWHKSIICDILIYKWHESSIQHALHSLLTALLMCVTWLIYMWRDSCICNMTHLYITRPACLWQHHSYMRHNPFTWYTTRVFEWHNSIICDMTHLHVTLIIYIARASLIFDSTIHVRDKTHPYVTWLMYMGHDSSI